MDNPKHKTRRRRTDKDTLALNAAVPKLSDMIRDVERHGLDTIIDRPSPQKRRIAVYQRTPPPASERMREALAKLKNGQHNPLAETRLNESRKRTCLYLLRYPAPDETLPKELALVARILQEHSGAMLGTTLTKAMQSRLAPRPFEFVLRSYASRAAGLVLSIDFTSAGAAKLAAERGNPYADIHAAIADGKPCPLCGLLAPGAD